MENKPDTIRSHCNQCSGERNHIILHREASDWEDDWQGNVIWGTEVYYLLKCAGCDSVHLRHESTFSEHPPEDGASIYYYPPAMSRRKPSWMSEIGWYVGKPSKLTISALLSEVYTALQNDSRRLAAMGVRAVLEMVMIDQIEDQGSIGKNVTAFIEAGFVPKVSHELFRNTLVEAGHAAMHRSYQPSKEHLEVLLDLTEWLIASIYVHPARAAKVKATIPKRNHLTAKTPES